MNATKQNEYMYVLEPCEGLAFHTSDFVMGYVTGSCPVDHNASSDDDQASWSCDAGPVQLHG
jgi:hypothetical protein